MGWLVNTTPRSLYPLERPGTHSIGGWVGPRTGLDGCGKSRPDWDSIPGLSTPCNTPRRPRWAVDCNTTLSLTSVIDGVGGQRHAPADLLPGKTPYPLHKGLGGSQDRSGRVRKISPPPPTGIQSPDRPTRSQSLYRLRCPSPQRLNKR